MRAAFVTNVCTHYRRPLLEALARRMDVDVFLTSRGGEWYALPEYADDGFPAQPATRRELVRGLVAGGYDAVLVGLAGRFAPLASYAVARLLRKRFVLWVGIWAHPGGLVHRLSRPLARHLYLHADAVVCYGPHVARFVEAESGRREGVLCARQAVDDERFRRPVPPGRAAALRAQLGLGAGRLVTFVGRFEEEKGLDMLLQASARTREEHRLLLVGKGSLEPELRALAAELGIEHRVRFAGYVHQGELPAILQASDVLVLPSVSTRRVRETWGLVLNEGMAAGTAVVATTAVGAAAGGLVLDGETGLIVPERDPAALAGALDRLLGDDVYRTTLALAGSRHVRAWSYEAAADAFEAALTGVPVPAEAVAA